MEETLQLHQHPGLNPLPFTTTIEKIERRDDGIWVGLNETACYPTGGGQPADHGIIQIGERIFHFDEVIKRQSILHRLPLEDSNSIEKGQEVVASIDVGRRNLLTRMHTAQHLVSAAADELFGAPTIGNQIGCERTRIDIGVENRDEFSQDELTDLVNSNVEAELPVEMSFMPRNDLIHDPLVRVNLDFLPKHVQNLRVITIKDTDICPCAGTHVGNTREIGTIEITKVKSKGAGKLRVEYTLVE